MEDRDFKLRCWLLLLWTGVLLIFSFFRAFVPRVILPAMDIPLLLAVSVLARLLERRNMPRAARSWLRLLIFSGAVFGGLTYLSGEVDGIRALCLAGIGALTFIAATGILDGMFFRLSLAETGAVARILHAMLLLLAGQGFANILL